MTTGAGGAGGSTMAGASTALDVSILTGGGSGKSDVVTPDSPHNTAPAASKITIAATARRHGGWRDGSAATGLDFSSRRLIRFFMSSTALTNVARSFLSVVMSLSVRSI